MKKLVLIDGNAIIHRAYHSMPKTLSTRKGEQTNAVYGFAVTLIKVLEDLRPEYIAATFDLAGPTFRHEVYTGYKATRVKADQDLYDQIPRVKQLVAAFGIPIYEKQGYEADDCLGTIVQQISKSEFLISLPVDATHQALQASKQIPNPKFQIQKAKEAGEANVAKKLEVFIVSGDKDIFQLINDNVKVYNLKKGLSQTQIVDSDTIKTEYGLDPHDFIDLKALAGDASDNIPGVPGIGPKTATQLLQTYDTLENLYATIEKFQIPNSKLQINPKSGISKIKSISHSELVEESQNRVSGEINEDKKNNLEDSSQNTQNDNLKFMAQKMKVKPRIVQLLVENKEQAFLSQHLATINTDVPIEFNLEKCKWGEYDKDKLSNLFDELGFQSLLRRFSGKAATTNETEEQKDRRTKEQGRTEVQKKDKQLKLL